MFLKMIKENKELHKILVTQQTQIGELIPKIGDTNSNNTINNKQKFNINIFLNEQCKDALTMNEFVEQIEVSMKNLLTTKDKGLSEGMSNIIIENMNKLSLYERPIHCTDKKRETVYVKCDANQTEEGTNGIPHWEKDQENKILKQVIKKVSHQQIKKIGQWVEKHPNWQNNPNELEEYMKMTKNCTDDLTENKREDKIIKNLCNNVHIGEEPQSHKI